MQSSQMELFELHFELEVEVGRRLASVGLVIGLGFDRESRSAQESPNRIQPEKRNYCSLRWRGPWSLTLARCLEEHRCKRRGLSRQHWQLHGAHHQC